MWEQPSEKHEATLYYFSGRGLADQARWLLAACDVSFTQKVVANRAQFERMAQRQLPFGQLPLLQIDGLEIVQSQAIVRYLARRANIQGQSEQEVLKSDMLAECVKDMLSPLTSLPFKRPARWTAAGECAAAGAELQTYRAAVQAVLDKWDFVSARLEAVLKNNHRAESLGKAGSRNIPSSDSTTHSNDNNNINNNMNEHAVEAEDDAESGGGEIREIADLAA